MVRAGQVERGSVLIIENIDRLSRQAVFKSLSLLVELVNAGIEVHTLGDGRIYGTTTGVGDLIVSLIGMERSYNESQTKSLRIRDSWKRRRANAHQKPMTSMARSWLRRDKDGKFELIEERAAIIRQIHEWCAGGVGIYAITARLNRSGVRPFGKSNGWHQSYVARLLKDRAVLGELQPHRHDDGRRVPEGDVISDYYPAVVDADTFYCSQSALGSRRNHGAGRKGANLSNLFSGLTVCACCHSKMHVVSKGSGPKGGRYLVCDASRRGLACQAGGWRLEHFETSFLSFVREADIGSLVRDDESKTRALDDESAAMRGRLASISEQMEKTYALLDTAPDFVAGKLRELEAQRVQLGTELKVKEAERIELESSRRRFEEGRDEIKALIEKLRGSGDEVYGLRASIAARLQSIVDTILIAPEGSAPMTRKAIEFLRGQEGSAPVIEHLERTIDGRRYFNVAFKDGAMRAVYPDPNDPARFTMQITSSRATGLVRHTPDTSTTVFEPRSIAST